MMRIPAMLFLGVLLAAGCAGTRHTLTFAGTKVFRERSVAWYYFRADPEQIENSTVWANIPCPKGTLAAVVGKYQSDDDNPYHSLHFSEYKELQVGPGTGGIVIGQINTRVNETMRQFYLRQGSNTATFQSGRHYVLCFETHPVLPLGSKPILPSLIGVIEVVPVPGATCQ